MTGWRTKNVQKETPNAILQSYEKIKERNGNVYNNRNGN